MKRSINILFHVGFGKTATSFMQRYVFPEIEKSIYLGKLYKGDLMLNNGFHKLHYNLFNSLNGMKRYRARNSEDLVSRYADKITKVILEEQYINCKSLIISNETIAGYDGYNAELNLFLLKRVFFKIEQILENEFDINFQVLFTFREQASLLQSTYAYDYYNYFARYPSFEKFIEYGLNNSREEIFGTLYIDEIIDFAKYVFKGDTVLFVPYEILIIDQLDFLKRTIVKLNLATIGEAEIILESIKEVKSENSNKNPDGSNNIRDLNFISKSIINLYFLKRFVPKVLSKYVKKNILLLEKNQNPINKTDLKVSSKQKKQIQDLYRLSNTRTEEILNINLSNLGYKVEQNQVSEDNPKV